MYCMYIEVMCLYNKILILLLKWYYVDYYVSKVFYNIIRYILMYFINDLRNFDFGDLIVLVGY